MEKILFIGLALALVSCGQTKSNEPAACKEVMVIEGEQPSLLPSDKKFELVWNDEFNGDSLDVSKWCYRTTFWMRKAHWFATPEDNAVEIKDGLAHLKIVKREDGQYVTPQLQTGHLIWDYPHLDASRSGFWPIEKLEEAKFLHGFGYYECRCRTQQMDGWWSAFWMQTESHGTTMDPRYAGIEHDIMESFVSGEIIPAAFHYNGYGKDHQQFTCPRSPDGKLPASTPITKEDFHTYGLLWEPDGYTLYLDGVARGPKLGKEGNEAVSQIPEFILISTEGHSFRQRNCTGPASPALEAAYAAGDEFLVDYVRVFDIR